MTLRGLLVDFGGVLTGNVFASFDIFCATEGLPASTVQHLFRTDEKARDLLSALEDGTLPEADFEERFAALLGVAAPGLIDRLMGHAGPDTGMLAAVRSARGQGIRTGLISNSWGVDRYDRALLDELFDGVVISGTVGIRKPAPEIYTMGAESLGLTADECVYVDDLPGNLKPARALGMTTLFHHSTPETIASLRDLLAINL